MNMEIKIEKQLMVDDVEFLTEQDVIVTTVTEEIVIGVLSYISDDSIDIDSKILGDITLQIDSIRSIEKFGNK